MEKNRINFARYQLLRYVEDAWTPIFWLPLRNLDEITNLPGHGLNLDELTVLLQEMFAAYELVACREGRGLFTPTLTELEAALAMKGIRRSAEWVDYGMTSAALDDYRLLGELSAYALRVIRKNTGPGGAHRAPLCRNRG